jgi:hypothetical protein
LRVLFEIEPPSAQTEVGVPSFNSIKLPDQTVVMEYFKTNKGFLLRFPACADFTVSLDGLSVRATPESGVSSEAVQHLYLNQVLPHALTLQGKLVFHASAVVVGGRAMAFVGESGRGKSTIAAAFGLAGCEVVTDDVLVLEATDKSLMVAPSDPSIRLWTDSERALLSEKIAKTARPACNQKIRLQANESLVFASRPQPIGGLYFLGKETSTDVQIEQLAGPDYVMEMVRHGYHMDIGNCSSLSTQFVRICDLCQEVPGFRLDYPRRFDLLHHVVQDIIVHRQCATW